MQSFIASKIIELNLKARHGRIDLDEATGMGYISEGIKANFYGRAEEMLNEFWDALKLNNSQLYAVVGLKQTSTVCRFMLKVENIHLNSYSHIPVKISQDGEVWSICLNDQSSWIIPTKEQHMAEVFAYLLCELLILRKNS